MQYEKLAMDECCGQRPESIKICIEGGFFDA